jgi:hypothetical protein
VGIGICIGGGGGGGGCGGDSAKLERSIGAQYGAHNAKLGRSISTQYGARNAKLGSRRLPLEEATQRAGRCDISSAVVSAMPSAVVRAKRLVLALPKVGRDDEPCELRHRGQMRTEQLDGGRCEERRAALGRTRRRASTRHLGGLVGRSIGARYGARYGARDGARDGAGSLDGGGS